MPSRKTKRVSSAPSNGRTVSEMRDSSVYRKYKIQEYSKSDSEGLKMLRDISKAISLPSSTYSKSNLRTFLQNISSNEQNLRNLSRFLYYRSYPYWKLVNYYAKMFMLNAHIIIPEVSVNKSNNNNKILKSFADTGAIVDRMNLPGEFLDAYITCFVEDVYYGVKYLDDTGMIFIKMDPDYCRIAGKYQNGDFAYAMNMSYFRSRQAYLNFLGEPFTSMYEQYLNDPQNMLWQVVPKEYAVCLKFSSDDWQTIVPPFVGMFESIISLCDLESIQAIADKQAIYKMIYFKIPTLPNAKQQNQWGVDEDTVGRYFDKMDKEGAIPDYISSVITPVDIGSVSFNGTDKVDDTNKLSKAYKNLFNVAGGGQILNSGDITGTEAWKAAKQADTSFAISSLLSQTQSWVNRQLSYELSSPSKVVFMPVSVYTKDDYKQTLLADGQNGLPVRLALNTLNGISELQTLSLLTLENDILQLDKKFVPLISSNTVSHTEATQAQDGGVGNSGEKDDNT